jgi:hypothetical protein
MFFGRGKSETFVVAFPSDEHVNSTVALLPRYAELYEGGYHRNDKVQSWILDCWEDSWKKIWDIKKETGGKLIVVNNGDALDDPVHATTHIVSLHKLSVIDMALKVYDKPRDMADCWFQIRGTEAHVGPDASWEEILADEMEAEPDPVTGRSSWWYWEAEIGGVKMDAAHHPETGGRMPHTQNAAASRQSFMLELHYGRDGEEPPLVSVRSHKHQAADSGVYTKPRVFYTWSWQLTPVYARRWGAGARVKPIGTLVLVIKDGRVTVIPDIVYQPKRRKPWRIEDRMMA